MNDNLDTKLCEYFENIEIPDNLDIVIKNAINKSGNHKNKLYHKYIRNIASVLIIFTLIGSITFAKNIADYITELFSHTHEGVVKALENGYITSTNMEYIGTTKFGVKIDSIMMDDFNLLVTFKIKMEENHENINNIKIPDLMITDENNNIIFCDYENSKGYEEFCKKNNIEYSKMNMKNNYTNNGYATQIIQKEKDEIVFVYKAYSSEYPKSKQLYINFKSIVLEPNKIGDSSITKTGAWKIKLDLPEEFYNRKMEYYTVKDKSDEDNNIKIKNAIVSNTEMKIHFTNIVSQYETDKKGENEKETESENEIIEKLEAKINEIIYKKDLFYEDIELENEKGEVFKRTQVNDSDGTTYSENGKIESCATFTMTKYDMTDTMKLKMFKDNKIIIINLTRK